MLAAAAAARACAGAVARDRESPRAGRGRLTPRAPSARRRSRALGALRSPRGGCCTSASTRATRSSTRPSTRRYGDAMAHGDVPYRDFDARVPAAARCPCSSLPALGHAEAADVDRYRSVFEALMFVCGCAAIALIALGAARARRDRRRLLAGSRRRALPARARVGRAVALRPLAGGAHRSARWRALCLGPRPARLRPARRSATATKLYPAVLLPLALAWTWRRARPARGARLRAGSSSPSSLRGLPAVRRARHRTASRWSLGAAADAAAPDREPRRRRPARRAPGVRARDHDEVGSHGSQNLVGTLPNVLAVVPDGAPGRRARRGSGSRSRAARPTRERLVRYSAAAIVRVRRAREGALAAVPDLARAARPARRRAPRPRRRGAARSSRSC